MAAPKNRTEEECRELRVGHLEELLEFREHIFPVFAEMGFTLVEALIYYKLNQVNNNIATLQDIVLNRNPDDDEDEGSNGDFSIRNSQ